MSAKETQSGCNKLGSVLSFLYLQHIMGLGEFKNASKDVLEALEEKVINNLNKAAKEKRRYFEFRKSIGDFPVINFISKDYINTVDYSEEYTKPIQMQIDKNFTIETINDIKYNSNKNRIKREDGVSEMLVPYHKYGYKLDYEKGMMIAPLSENATVSSLLKTVDNEMFSAIDLTVYRYGEKSEASIKEAFLEFDIDADAYSKELERFFLVAKDNSGVFDTIYPIAKIDFKDILSDMLAEITDKALSPIRVDNKPIEMNFLPIEETKDRIKQAILAKTEESLRAVGISDERNITSVTDIAKAILESKKFNEALSVAIDRFKDKAEDEAIGIFNYFASVGNLKKYTSDIQKKQYAQSVTEILSDIRSGAIIEYDMRNETPKNTRVPLLPSSNSSEIVLSEVSVYAEVSSDSDISKFDKVTLSPKEITLTATFAGGGKSSVLYRSFDLSQTPKIKELKKVGIRSTTNKTVKISKTYAEDADKILGYPAGKKRRCFINDEADDRSAGEEGNAITQVVKLNASTSVVATGTPGYRAEHAPKLIKLNGKIPLEALKTTEMEFSSLYGVSEIKSPFIALVAANMKFNKDIESKLFDSYETWSKAKKGDGGINIDELLFSTSKMLARILVDHNHIEEEEFDNMNFSQEAINLMILFSTMKQKERGEKKAISVLVEEGLLASEKLLKKAPKIGSIKSYASAFSALIGKNGTSSTNAGAKKETVFLNTEKLINNFNRKSPALSIAEFKKMNREGARAVQAILPAYSKMMFISDSYWMLTSNFSSMMGTILKSNDLKRELLQILSNRNDAFAEINISKLSTLASKTTTESKDDFAGIYEIGLRSGEESFETFFAKDDIFTKQREFFFHFMLETFKKYMEKLPEYHSEMEAYAEKVRTAKKGSEPAEPRMKLYIDDKEIDLGNVSYTYSPTFDSQDQSVSVEEYLIKNLNDIAVPKNIPFSVMIDLCPYDMKGIIEPNSEGMRIPYRYEFMNREENRVLDIVSTLGFKEEIKKQIKNGANGAATNTRTIGQIFSLLNTILAIREIREEYEAGKLSKEEERAFDTYIKENTTLIYNQTSKGDKRFNGNDVIDRIIEQPDIEIKTPKRSHLESLAKKTVIYDMRSSYLYGNKASISRGFDLSYFHKKDENGEDILATMNFIDPEISSDTIQVLSRLENPKTTKNIINLSNGGADAKLFYFGEAANESMGEFIDPSALEGSASKNVKEKAIRDMVSNILGGDDEVQSDASRLIREKMSFLKRSMGISENASNAIRTEMGVETYNMIMEGRYAILSDDEKEKLYIKSPVIDVDEDAIRMCVSEELKAKEDREIEMALSGIDIEAIEKELGGEMKVEIESEPQPAVKQIRQTRNDL